ncbi:MAG: ABC transporter ATP-binding protein [Syntrophobacteraceae bacterium]
MSAELPGKETVLETKNLTREIPGKVLVNGISLRVDRGEFLAIVGPSGAGKSSFLRLINRLDEPTGGAVYLHGREYREFAPRELRRKVGMMMQSAYLFPGTVADNLSFGPRQHGELLSPSKIEELLEQVRLAGFSGRDISNLSGGEAQRVSLARTLANKPEVLLLDEPTASLDERAEREIETLLTSVLAEHRLTALMVTHDSAQAVRIANRAILIDAGRLVFDGKVQEALHAQSTLE